MFSLTFDNEEIMMNDKEQLSYLLQLTLHFQLDKIYSIVECHTNSFHLGRSGLHIPLCILVPS